MHAQLLSSLAAEHRRDLAAASDRRSQSARVQQARVQRARVEQARVEQARLQEAGVQEAGVQAAGAPAARARRVSAVSMPRLHVSWTKTRIAAVSGARRGSSVVIVISATRTS